MQRMIRQFAVEYTSKPSSTQDSSQPNSTKNQSLPKASPTQTSPTTATLQNPVLSKLLMADQDIPLDLTVRKSEPSEQEGVLDLSTKKSPYVGNTSLSHSPSCSSTIGNGEETSQIIEMKSTTNQPESALEKFMIRLCSHHQKQFIHVLSDLCTERYHLPDTAPCMSSCSLQNTEICDTDTDYSEMKSSSLSELHQDKVDCQRSACVGAEHLLEHSINKSTELKCADESKCSSSLVKDNSYERPTRTYSTRKVFSVQQCTSFLNSSPNVHHISENFEEQTPEQASIVKTCQSGKDQAQNKSLVKGENGSDSLSSRKNSLKSLPEALSNFTANLHRTVNSANTLQYSTKVSLHQDLASVGQDANLKQENLQHLLGRNKASNYLLNGEMNQFENSKDGWLASSPYSDLNKTSNGHTKVKSNSTAIKANRKCKRASGLRINDYDNQCDVVYISQPITECHLENQRSLISLRKTARKSTRGYFFNGECCELPTVRTLVKSSTSVAETVTPNQVLVVPGTLPVGEIPIIRNSQEIDGVQAPLKLLLQGTPFSKEKLDETVTKNLELQFETFQADPLVSRETASGPLMALLSLVHNEKSKEESSGKSKIITCSSPTNKNVEKKIELLDIMVGVQEDTRSCTKPSSENTLGNPNSKTVECGSVCLSDVINTEEFFSTSSVSPSEVASEEGTMVLRPISPSKVANGKETIDSRPVFLIKLDNQRKTTDSSPMSPIKDGNREESIDSGSMSPVKDWNREEPVDSRSSSPIKDGNREEPVDSRSTSPIKDRNQEEPVDSRSTTPIKDGTREDSRSTTPIKDGTREEPVDSRSSSPIKDGNREEPVDSRSSSPIKEGNREEPVDSRSTSPIKEGNREEPVDSRSTSPIKEGNREEPVDSRSTSPIKEGNREEPVDSRSTSPIKDGNREEPVDSRSTLPIKDGNREEPVDSRSTSPIKDGNREEHVDSRSTTPIKDGNREEPVDSRSSSPIKDGNREEPVDSRSTSPIKDGNREEPVDSRSTSPIKDGNREEPVDSRSTSPIKHGNLAGAVDSSPMSPIKNGHREGAADTTPVSPIKDGNPEAAVAASSVSPIKDMNSEGAAESNPMCLKKDKNPEEAVDLLPMSPIKDGNPEGATDSSSVSPIKDGIPEGAAELSPMSPIKSINQEWAADTRHSVSPENASTEDMLDYSCTVSSMVVNEENINGSAQPSPLEVDIGKEAVVLECMSSSEYANGKDFHCSNLPQFLISSMGTVDLSRKVNIAPEKEVILNDNQMEQSEILINADLNKISENKIFQQKKNKHAGKRQNGNLSTERKSVKVCIADRDCRQHNAVKKKKKGKKVPLTSDRCLRSQQCQSLTACIKENPISSSTFKLPCLQIELLKKLGSKRYKRMVRIRKARYVFFPTDCFHKTLLKNIGKKNLVIDFEDLAEVNGVAIQQYYKSKIAQENINTEGWSGAGVTDIVNYYKSREKLEISIDINSDKRKINFPKAKKNCREQAKKKPRSNNAENLESSERKFDNLALSQKPMLNSPTLHNTRSGVKPLTSRSLSKHKKLAFRSYNLRHSPVFESNTQKKHLAKENTHVSKKPVKDYALENEDAIDLKDVNAHEDVRPKFVDWCTEEENQELIAGFNAKYIKIQKGWIQLEKDSQPVPKTKSKSDKLKEIWRTKKRVRKTRNSLEVQKLSPIQMLFMKPFKLSNICKWFLETTETRSLVIVKKLNTRIPGEFPVPLIPLQKYSSSNLYPHSLQAERLKKHLKKFPGATPLRNNWKNQNLWAKFRETNNKTVTNESPSTVFISASTNSDEHFDLEDTKSSPSLKTSSITQMTKKHSTLKGKVGAQYSLIKDNENNENAVDQEKVEPSRKSVCINPLMSPKLALQVKADAFSRKAGQVEEELKGKKRKKRSNEDISKTDVQLGKKKKIEGDDIDMKDVPSSSNKEKLSGKKTNKAKHLELPSKSPTTRKQAAVEKKNKVSSKLSLLKKKKAITRKKTIRDSVSIQKANVMKNKRRQRAASRQPVTKSPKQRTRKTISRLLKEMETERHSIKTQTRSLKNVQNTVALKKRKLRSKLNPTEHNKRK